MGSKSSSKSSQSSTVNNTDKRIANQGGISISSEGSSVTVNALDGDIVKESLKTIQMNDAKNGDGFEKLLNLADKFVTGGAELVSKSQDTVLQSLQSIENDKRGAIDQKTMIILGVSAAVAFVASRGR